MNKKGDGVDKVDLFYNENCKSYILLNLFRKCCLEELFGPPPTIDNNASITLPALSVTAIQIVDAGSDGTGGNLPEGFELRLEIYPNPFNPETIVRYHIDEAAHVRLQLFDVHGRQIRSVDRGWQDSGEYHYLLNGIGLASGVYFVQLTADKRSVEKRVTLIR